MTGLKYRYQSPISLAFPAQRSPRSHVSPPSVLRCKDEISCLDSLQIQPHLCYLIKSLNSLSIRKKNLNIRNIAMIFDSYKIHRLILNLITNLIRTNERYFSCEWIDDEYLLDIISISPRKSSHVIHAVLQCKIHVSSHFHILSMVNVK